MSVCAMVGILAVCGFESGCACTGTRDSAGEFVDDATITTKVKGALLADGAVKSFEIKVETFKGVVQLSGYVDNDHQRFAAGKDALAVNGVKCLMNDLVVK